MKLRWPNSDDKVQERKYVQILYDKTRELYDTCERAGYCVQESVAYNFPLLCSTISPSVDKQNYYAETFIQDNNIAGETRQPPY